MNIRIPFESRFSIFAIKFLQEKTNKIVRFGVTVCLMFGYVSAVQAQTCAAPTTLTFANLVSTTGVGGTTSGDLYAGAVKVGTFSADIPGNQDSVLIRNAGSTLSIRSFTGTAAGNLPGGFYRLTITAAPGSIISGGSINFTAKSTYQSTTQTPYPFTGYNNFKQFSVNGTKLSNVHVVQDITNGFDFLEAPLSINSVLTLNTQYTSIGGTNNGQKTFANAPGFILAYETSALTAGQSATMEFQKYDASVEGTWSAETHDYVSALSGCVASVATPNLSLNKSSAIFNTGNPLFYLPTNDVTYSLSLHNSGAGSPTPDSILIVDSLPSNVTFYNGDADGSGPGTTPVLFTDASSGLTFNYATDVKYASGSTPPSSFAACTYTPAAGYDPNVRYVCINPKGTMANTGTFADPNFSVLFRTRIN